jgi:excisionase family DNA binding protein
MQRKREKAKTATESIEAAGSLLTISEASRLLHVHENTLRRWGKSGIIKVYRIGPARQRRFKAEDLGAFVGEETKRLRADTTKLRKFPK